MATIIDFPDLIQRSFQSYEDFRGHGLSHESAIIAQAYATELDLVRDQLAEAQIIIKRLKRQVEDRRN